MIRRFARHWNYRGPPGGVRRAAAGQSPGCSAGGDCSIPSPAESEALMDRYIEVTGGKAAYEKRTSEITTGTMEFAAQGLKGADDDYSAPPDKTYDDGARQGSERSSRAPSTAWRGTRTP